MLHRHCRRCSSRSTLVPEPPSSELYMQAAVAGRPQVRWPNQKPRYRQSLIESASFFSLLDQAPNFDVELTLPITATRCRIDDGSFGADVLRVQVTLKSHGSAQSARPALERKPIINRAMPAMGHSLRRQVRLANLVCPLCIQ